MNAEQATVSRETIADDFRTEMRGKMEQEKIDAVVQSLAIETASYPAHAGAKEGSLYVTIEGGKTFTAYISVDPPGEKSRGSVYTDDINRLYTDTVAFHLTATPVYLSIFFLDSRYNLLGYFQGGPGIISGVGGGGGRWS